MIPYTGRSKPGTMLQTAPGELLGGLDKQLVSTGGTAALGESTVTELEPLLKTTSCVPPEFAMTVSALVTAIDVVSPPPEKFITCTAPVKEKPVTVAVGTAAYPMGEAVGMTMLEVGPERRTFPIAASLVVSTA